MKYSVDKIENEIAVIENIINGEKKEVPLINLPSHIKEGSILLYEDNLYQLDIEEEKIRRQRIMDKFKKLKQ